MKVDVGAKKVYIHLMAIEGRDLQGACVQVHTTCGCEGTRRTARALTQLYEEALAPSGLRATQLPILVALGAAGPLPVTRLAGALAIDRTTLTRNLKGLEERCLVDVVPADDGRVRVVTLTPSGRRLLQESIGLWSQAQASVEERFGKARLEHLVSELSALTELVRH
jgi:DNA-binding MarR family transcriptional regulator